MSEFISRYDRSGKSIAHKIYHGVENGTIRLIAKEIADGRRLDHYAQIYYGNGLNSWIIAAASGIRWPLGIGSGAANKSIKDDDSTVLFIPSLDDVIALKSRS
tara:strand:- start:1136 stop:1444 length:309 start_codon:yes stop_codon:yes gene_type:complete